MHLINLNQTWLLINLWLIFIWFYFIISILLKLISNHNYIYCLFFFSFLIMAVGYTLEIFVQDRNQSRYFSHLFIDTFHFFFIILIFLIIFFHHIYLIFHLYRLTIISDAYLRAQTMSLGTKPFPSQQH